MYTVKVTVKASDPDMPEAKFSSKTYTGIYFSKDKVAITKIKKETEEYFNGKLAPCHPTLRFAYAIEARRIKDDFLIAEGCEHTTPPAAEA